MANLKFNFSITNGEKRGQKGSYYVRIVYDVKQKPAYEKAFRNLFSGNTSNIRFASSQPLTNKKTPGTDIKEFFVGDKAALDYFEKALRNNFDKGSVDKLMEKLKPLL